MPRRSRYHWPWVVAAIGSLAVLVVPFAGGLEGGLHVAVNGIILLFLAGFLFCVLKMRE